MNRDMKWIGAVHLYSRIITILFLCSGKLEQSCKVLAEFDDTNYEKSTQNMAILSKDGYNIMTLTQVKTLLSYNLTK